MKLILKIRLYLNLTVYLKQKLTDINSIGAFSQGMNSIAIVKKKTLKVESHTESCIH
jgi:hypothetical protein